MGAPMICDAPIVDPFLPAPADDANGVSTCHVCGIWLIDTRTIVEEIGVYSHRCDHWSPVSNRGLNDWNVVRKCEHDAVFLKSQKLVQVASHSVGPGGVSSVSGGQPSESSEG